MDYFKIYKKLMETRKDRFLLEYSEKHHIIPKCLGGSDDKNNIVRLTYKEHYIAHYLLTKIYPDNPKIQYAFLCMLRNPHGERILTSGMYDTIKRNYSEFRKWYSKINNPGRSKKSRQKAKNRMLSSENPMRKYPEKNHTVRKTTIFFTDGRIEQFDYAKQACEKYGIPEVTLKWCFAKNKGSRKHNIMKIVKSEG